MVYRGTITHFNKFAQSAHHHYYRSAVKIWILFYPHLFFKSDKLCSMNLEKETFIQRLLNPSPATQKESRIRSIIFTGILHYQY